MVATEHKLQSWVEPDNIGVCDTTVPEYALDATLDDFGDVFFPFGLFCS